MGSSISRRGRKRLLGVILIWLLIYLTAFTSIGIIARGGYRLPMMPFVVIYAALAIYASVTLGERFWKRVVRTESEADASPP